jgi:hypothetical protein
MSGVQPYLLHFVSVTKRLEVAAPKRGVDYSG